MQSTITRRAALTGTAAGAAAIVAGAAPALADDDHDRAEWLALWKRWLDQCKRDSAASAAADDAEFSAKATYPVSPPILQTRLNGQLVLDARSNPKAVTRETMENHARAMLETWGDNPMHGDDVRHGIEIRRAAFEAYEVECRAVDEAFNVPALKAAADREQEQLEAIAAEITERPALCITGIAVKLALNRWMGNDGLDEVEAATDDLLRLAGLPEDMGEEWRRERPEVLS